MWWFIKITCFPCPVNHWHALTSMQNKSALIHPIQPSSSFKGCVSVAGLLSFARGPWVQNRDDYLKIVMHVSMSTSAHVSRSQGFVPSLALSLLPLSPQTCYCSLPSRQQQSALTTLLVCTPPHLFVLLVCCFLAVIFWLDLPVCLFFTSGWSLFPIKHSDFFKSEWAPTEN